MGWGEERHERITDQLEYGKTFEFINYDAIPFIKLIN